MLHFILSVAVDELRELFNSDEGSDKNPEEGNEVNARRLSEVQSVMVIKIGMRNSDEVGRIHTGYNLDREQVEPLILQDFCHALPAKVTLSTFKTSPRRLLAV